MDDVNILVKSQAFPIEWCVQIFNHNEKEELGLYFLALLLIQAQQEMRGCGDMGIP